MPGQQPGQRVAARQPAQAAGQGSDGDLAACDPGGNCDTPKYAPTEDHQNLKCFNQKKRYGVDFLYPTSRYVNAFTQFKIDPGEVDYAGDAVDNPLFQDLGGTGGQ